MKLKTNLMYDARPHTYRRVWVDENVDLFILIRGEKCVLQHNDFHMKLPNGVRYCTLGESKEETQ